MSRDPLAWLIDLAITSGFVLLCLGASYLTGVSLDTCLNVVTITLLISIAGDRYL